MDKAKFAVLTTVVLALAGCGKSESPSDLKAETNENAVRITSFADGEITINRIIINRREGEKGCDSAVVKDGGAVIGMMSPLPITLKRGDRLGLISLFCGQPTYVQAYDNAGNVHEFDLSK